MKIFLSNANKQYSEIFSLGDLDNIHETFEKISYIKEGPLEAKIFAINESISSHKLSNLKSHILGRPKKLSETQVIPRIQPSDPPFPGSQASKWKRFFKMFW